MIGDWKKARCLGNIALRHCPFIGRASIMSVAVVLSLSCGLVWAEDSSSEPPSAEAMEAIRLLGSKDSYERQRAFLRLEALREPATAPLIRKWITDRDPWMRAGSLRALAAIQGEQAVGLLLERLADDRNPAVRRAILLGLEVFPSRRDQTLPAFIAALRDRNTEVRITAVDIVSRIDDPRAREAILTRRKRERRRDVQRVLAVAVRRIEAP